MTRHGKRRARRLALIITALLGLAVPPAFAAENGAAADAERPADGEASQPAADNPANGAPPAEEGATADAESPDVFVPSEEISEDFAVSFPVDI